MTYLFNDIQKVSKNENVNSTNNPIYVNSTPDLSIGNFYGEPYSIILTPVVQLDGIYGIDARETQIYTAGGGSASSSNSCYHISCTSTVGSYGVLRSRRFNTYKSGQSGMARGYLKFDTPVAGTSQRWGLQNQENAFYIGYNGTSFGILHTYGGRVPLYRLTITSYTGNQTVTVTLNGTAYTVNIVDNETIQEAAQRIALDSGWGSGTWLTTQRSNTIEFLYTGTLGPLGGSFSVTSSGNLSAAITTIQTGVAASNEWFYPGDTDVDSGYVFPALPTWFYPERFNEYQIKYNWSGVNFFLLNPTTGKYNEFYRHTHPGNGATRPEVSNPAFKVATLCYNIGGSSGVTINVGSMSMFLEGQTNRNKYNRSAAITQNSLSANDLHHLLSIQNALTYNGTINTLEILLQDITVTTQCNDPSEIYVFLDAPLSTGIHNFESTSGFAAGVSKATGLIDITTNQPLLSFVVGNTGSSVQFDLSNYRTVIPPGATISIAIRGTAVLQKAAAALVWCVD